MELDDLKLAWSQLDQRVHQLEAVVVKGREERALGGARHVLRTLGWCQAAQAVLWMVAIAFVAPFWIEHRAVPHLLIAGLVLHACGVLTICSSVVQLLWILLTYWTTPVVTFQRRLAQLQRLRILSSLTVGLSWLVLWVPATMVVAKMAVGVDLYAESSPWINQALQVGTIGMVLTLVLARYLADRPIDSPVLRRLVDDLAGRSLVRATRQLQQAAAFARD